jgi:hypothetical protein
MKFNFIYLIIFAAFISTAAIQVTEEIDVTMLKSELKRELRPDYKYDSSKVSSFTYNNESQVKEIEVPLFMGEKYRFLFNINAAKGVKVEIYSKPSTSKNRKLLYTLNEQPNQYVYTFEPEKSSKMYINYTIPAGSGLEGKMIFVLGYK